MPTVASRVVCVVVTHGGPEALNRCLAALVAQTRPPDHLVLVDGGPGERNREVLGSCPIPHTRLSSPGAVGGAGGFADGILRARELGADWVWLADGGGHPGSDRTLATLLRCADDRALDAVSPLVVDLADPQRLAVPLRRGLTWVRTRAELEGRHFLPGIAQLFAGALFSDRALECVGGPDPRLVIRGDEVEVHRRMVRSGLRFGTCAVASYADPPGAGDVVLILAGRVPVYAPIHRDRADAAFRNQGYLTRQPGMRWRRWPDEARYAWYYLATQRDVTGWRHWQRRTAEGRREQFTA